MTATPNTAVLQALLKMLLPILDQAHENSRTVEAEWSSTIEGAQPHQSHQGQIEQARVLIRALIAAPVTENEGGV